MLIFPTIPASKLFIEGSDHTGEQLAMQKAFAKIKLSPGDNQTLEECANFYEDAFKYLGTINLSEVTEQDKDSICEYLKKILGFQLTVQNSIGFLSVFRVTFVRDQFLENDKVKDINFLKHPPLDLIIHNGVYGRCNSNSSTRFYSSFDAYTAVLETKPQVGDRIILTEWRNVTGRKFIIFPLSNTNLIENEGIQKATEAMKERLSYNHPEIARALVLTQKFFAEQFVKRVPIIHPKKYEYLFSAFFSDYMLKDPLNPTAGKSELLGEYDGIVYPSVACNHELENFVLTPEAALDLVPYIMGEWLVTGTNYEISKAADARSGTLPITGDFLRHSMAVKDGKIIWNDEVGIP